MVSCGGVRFMWEVADPQSLFPVFHRRRQARRLGLSWEERFLLRNVGLFMAWLSSPKKQQSRRVLKKSDLLFFQGMTHRAGTRGVVPS
jgi:hypothetical protein